MTDIINQLFNLEGKSALITGATGSLGAAAARALSGAGAHVTIAGGNATALAELKAEIEQAGGAVQSIASRPSSEAECQKIVAAASADGRGLDILISASGTAKIKPALEMEPGEWDTVMDANVRQSWLITRAAGKIMVEQGRGGSVVLVSSVRSRFATPAGTTAYGPSKAAVDMLTKSFATEWGKHDITVNAIAPTVFRSELTAWLFEDDAAEQRKGVLSRIPLGRLAEPEDFAGSIIFLCAPGGSYVTGEILNVDGGFCAN
ncbi:MAG: oxidoreductase [Oceanobacter sp.]|jgi:NAD(P)-dependent dehydrogenase (short-subunit alcohol dehydrogenase family)|nr:MAG: oxidoreductase [Oceanobacter sp.]|tara:strand:+ start:4415 stop:5200 length:786 start_codon:yes stop_codon:yes gene_type:complete